MVLTSVPHRRRTPTRNLRIPTNAVGALMTGSSMSALWTLGRGILAAPPGTLPQARTPLAPCVALARGREIVVRRRLWPGPFQNRLYATRAGIYWPRVVHTARRPHLPAVHPPPSKPDPRGAPPSQASTAHSKEDHAPNHTAPIDAREHSINSQHPNTLQRATAWETSLHDRRSQDAFIDLELRAQEPTTSLRPSNRCQSRIIP